MPIDKFDTEHFNAAEDNLLEYVIAVADKIAPDYCIMDNNAYEVDSQAPVIFRQRYNNNTLSTAFLSYHDFTAAQHGENSIAEMLESLGIDIEKFWYLLLFTVDYVVGSTFNTIKLNDTPREEIIRFVNLIESALPVSHATGGKAMTLTLSLKGRRLIITNPDTISILACLCKKSLSEMPTSLIADRLSADNGHFKSQSVAIWLFAKIFKCFFSLYPQFVGKRGKRTGVSRSTWLLISKLAYFARLTRNVDYNSSDECLKALYRQYRNFRLDTLNIFYGSGIF